MTITADQVKDLRGTQVLDSHDEKVGKVSEVYVDNESGQPKWVTVNTGMMGRESFVPLDGAKNASDALRVATDKKTIKDAPHTGEATGEISRTDEDRLANHYGLSGAEGSMGHGGNDRREASDAEHDDADHGKANRGTTDRESREHDHGDHGMTRSEERLSVGTESYETGQVRLRKYVVTEHQSVDVPVSHEEVRLEREQVDEQRPSRGSIGDDEQSVTLHAERPVVSKDAYEVEKVRLGTRSVTENETVSDEVRKEQIDVDDPKNALSGRTKK